MNTPHRLLIAQIIAHLSIIPMVMYASWWQWLIALFVYFLTGCLGMTMNYHRLLSHRSWKCPLWFEHVLTIITTIGLTGSAIGWVAIHRKHHRFTDQVEDPHSPVHIGFLRAHFLSMYAKVELRFARGLLKSKFYMFQHNHYFTINAIYGLVLFLLDPMAVVYAWLFPAMVLWNGGSSVLSYSHRGGAAKNDKFLGILVWGEGWHKNHHDFPNNAIFNDEWDLAGKIIKLIDKKAV